MFKHFRVHGANRCEFDEKLAKAIRCMRSVHAKIFLQGISSLILNGLNLYGICQLIDIW